MHRVLKIFVLLFFPTTFSSLPFVFSSINSSLSSSTNTKKCVASSNMLTFSCDANCPERPCLIYEPKMECNATSFSTCEQGNTSTSSSTCQYECFKLSPDDFYKNSLTQRSNFTFLIPFGEWKSEKEEEEWKENKNEKQKMILKDDTNEFPSKSNNLLKKMDVLALPKSIKRLTVAGGTSIAGNRGQVANVKIPSEFLFQQTQLESVTLANLNIGQVSVSSFSSQLESLTMSNCLLTLFPDDIESMSKLTSLDLSKNYLKTYPIKYSKDKLTFVNLSGNNLDTFDAPLFNVQVLDLSENLLTDIPRIIFKMNHLKKLYLQGNSLKKMELTSTEFDFLLQLETFFFDTLMNVSSCGPQEQKQFHQNGVIVCVVDNNNKKKKKKKKNLILWIIIGIVMCVTCTMIIKRRRGRRQKAIIDAKKKKKMTMMMMIQDDGDDPVESFDFHSSHIGKNNKTTTKERKSTIQSIWQDQQLLSLQVNSNEIEDIKKIGNGAFGIVWLARYRRKQLVASKRLREDEVNWKNTQMFIEEIKLVAQFDHPRIVQLVGVAWTIESDLQALFEYMQNGDLRTHLDHIHPTSSTSLSKYWSRMKIQIAIDIIEALVYLHSFQPPLVHRDLKSRNVLLSNDMRAKVSDFGISRFHSEDNTMTSGIGTGRWLAPEVIAGVKDYDQSVDIFSFGVVLSELDTHQIPYLDVKGANGVPLSAVAILQMVAAGQLKPSFSTTCPPQILQVARKCLMYDHKERPTAVEIAFLLRSYLKQEVDYSL